MADVFDTQLEFLRRKLDVPTEKWNDLWQEQHDRAFVAAKAMQADLLADLHGAVDRAIADGQSLEDFKAGFDDLVTKHGWLSDTSDEYRAWRAKMIYETNLRTSYAAGRYAYLSENVDAMPYWRWNHSDASIHPRPSHVALDGLILPASDPFWQRGFPPAGFNCFPAGTLVATPDGWRSIETIKRGDLVIGGSGNVQPVTAPQSRSFDGNIVRVVAEKVEVLATPNHRFLTMRGWIKAENLESGDVLVQIPEVAALDIPVGDVDQANPLCRDVLMPTPKHGAAAGFGEALNAKRQLGHKHIYPVRGDTMVMRRLEPPSTERVQHALLAFGWLRVIVGMGRRVSDMRGLAGCDYLGAHFRASCRRAVLQFFRRALNSFVCLLRLSESVVFSFSRLIEGYLAHHLCADGATPISALPLQLDGFAAAPGLDAKMLHHPHDRARVTGPSGAKVIDPELLIDIEGAEGFAGGAPLDRFHSIDDFVSWAGAHCSLTPISRVERTLYTCTVYNLSVYSDESYCIPVGVVHNCKCTVDGVNRAAIRAQRWEIGVAPADFEPDPGWAYAPGASVESELAAFLEQKTETMPAEIRQDLMSALADRVTDSPILASVWRLLGGR